MTVQETCAFDSLLQLVISRIAAHEMYRNEIESSSDCIFQLAKDILENGKIILIHYNKRASILQDIPLFSDAIITYTRGIKRLNDNCNVAHLAEYIFKNEPSCVFNKSCCVNLYIRVKLTCNINVNIILQEGLQLLQRVIDDLDKIRSKCRTCGADYQVSYGKYVIIDSSIFTDYRYVIRCLDVKHNLNSITKIITLNNINYILAGIIHYVQYGDNNNGHYIAFAYAGTYWYKYNDLKKNVYLQ